jgi:hypothetical protein
VYKKDQLLSKDKNRHKMGGYLTNKDKGGTGAMY